MIKRIAKKVFAPQALPLAMFLAASALMLDSACGPNHIRSTTPHMRPSPFRDEDYAVSNTDEHAGSLWDSNSSGLAEDFRARHRGDILTVVVDESVSATGDASTDLQRQAGTGLPNVFGLASAIASATPGFDASALLTLMANQDYAGTGTTTRGTTASGTIACTVDDVAPNGNLFIQGEKVILINQEELHINISGVIRPEDIRQDNSIGSSLMALAQVEFTGRGAISDTQRQGWLRRLMNKVRPF